MKVAQPVSTSRSSGEIFGIRLSSRWLALVPPLVLFVLTLLVLWQYDPLHRSLLRDPGIFAYLSQLVAQGYVPHRDAFNEQASLTFIVGGLAMRLGDLFGLHHLISFRFAAMLAVALVVVLTYLLGARFTRSRVVGFIAALILLGFPGYGERAATALEPKGLMLVFGLTALLFLTYRKWFIAGIFGALAALTWQTAAGYLLVALLLAFIQGGASWSARFRALGMTLAAALGVFGIYFLYFLTQNAQVEMLQQTLLAPGIMHRVAVRTLDWRIGKLIRTFNRGYSSHIEFGILALVGLLTWLVVYLRPWEIRTLFRRAFYYLFQNRRTAGILLTTFGFLLSSFLDFQNYPDWFPLLPFVSLFAAWLIWSVLTQALRLVHASPLVRNLAFAVVAVLVFYLSTSHLIPRIGSPLGSTWQAQQAVADELDQKLDPSMPIWLLGKADLLFFMRRPNLNRYIYFLGSADAAIEAFEPAGFEGMVAQAMTEKPVFYVLSRAKTKKFSKNTNLSYLQATTKEYVHLDRCPAVGAGSYYVRRDLADQLFPIGSPGCFTQHKK